MDSLTPRASVEMSRLYQAVSISVFNDFELENSVRMALFRKKILPVEAKTLLANFAADTSGGKVILEVCNLSAVVTEAKRLSLAYTLTGGHRSFDILHVAVALHLGATEFLSFDLNQRKLAKAVGLKVRPV